MIYGILVEGVLFGVGLAMVYAVIQVVKFAWRWPR